MLYKLYRWLCSLITPPMLVGLAVAVTVYLWACAFGGLQSTTQSGPADTGEEDNIHIANIVAPTAEIAAAVCLALTGWQPAVIREIDSGDEGVDEGVDEGGKVWKCYQDPKDAEILDEHR